MSEEMNVIELCPFCGYEIHTAWDTQSLGFKIFCPFCGNEVMLCDECLNAVIEDGEPRTCDWCESTNSCHLNPPKSKREWKETISPAYLHKTFGIYDGVWMPLMDRCWDSTDGYQVMSRLINTEFGKVEHVTIIKIADGKDVFSSNGKRDIPWAEKQKIKNELFGENRLAIEVFPKEKNLVDVMDVYHLWVFPKDFSLPFGIHPTKDKIGEPVKRGVNGNLQLLYENTKFIHELRKGKQGNE